MSQREIKFLDNQLITERLKEEGFAWIKTDECLIPAQFRPAQADYLEELEVLFKGSKTASVLEEVLSLELLSSLDISTKILNPFVKALITSHLSVISSQKDLLSDSFDVVVRAQRAIGTQNNPIEPIYIHQGAEFTAFHLMQRKNVRGGELQVVTENGDVLEQKVPTRIMDGALLLDSGIIIKETSISPINRLEPAIRDFLILEYYPRKAKYIINETTKLTRDEIQLAR